MRIWIALLILTLSPAVWSQEKTVSTTSVGSQEPITVNIEAQAVELTPASKSQPITRIHAAKNVLFQLEQKRLSADEVFYSHNQETGESTGLLTSAAFTMCDCEHPHYRLTTQQITLTPDNHLILKRVRVYLGKYRLISLPCLKLDVGPSSSSQSFLPRPGFSSFDGLFLSTNRFLISQPSSQLGLRLRLTTRNGITGGLTSAYAISGDLLSGPFYTPDYDSELRKQAMLKPIANGESCAFPAPQSLKPVASVFGAALSRERAYDIKEPDLLVSRLPEVGIRYVKPEVCIDDYDTLGLGARYELRTSWGRYKELPGDGYISRFDARGVATKTIAVRKSTELRATGLARVSTYSSNDDYIVLGAALEASRIYSKGSFASLRLIMQGTFGTTPFEFDNIDIPHELQFAGRLVRGRSVYGLLLDYDIDRLSLRDWSFSYGRRLHCLQPTITWRNRFSQISFNVKVLGL
jgi:hypothetical protein